MNYTIDPWFSPIFWLIVGGVLFAILLPTLKWRVRFETIKDISKTKKSFWWTTRIISILYWLLAVLLVLLALGLERSDWLNPRVFLTLGVPIVSLGGTALALWKGNFWGYALALLFNFLGILGFLLVNLYYAKFPCEGFGCLGLIIPYLGMAFSVIFAGITTPFLFWLLRQQTNWRAALYTMAVALFVSVALVGLWASQSLGKNLIEEGVAKQKFELFPKGILYPRYLPDAIQGPVGESKSSALGDYSYVIRYDCGENSNFSLVEAPVEAARRGKGDVRIIETYTGSGMLYYDEIYNQYVLERDGLEISFGTNLYCGLSQTTVVQIAESMEEK